jgi:hypothetical protein
MHSWQRPKINEMKALFAFMSDLYSALWEAYHNGNPPELNVRVFELPPRPPARSREMLPGETVYREGHAVLNAIVAAASR